MDGGAPYHRCYLTSDGGWMAVGAIEARFYAVFLRLLGLDPASLPAQNNREGWPVLVARLAERFRSRTRAEWQAVFSGSDARVSHVLTLRNASGIRT
jgi:alpha-methylacyl-CoA racemase